ncbi:trimethylguanosine synthase [Venturia nashicola]|nr:trimethylguanosine synthase [Venturia nashicola]
MSTESNGNSQGAAHHYEEASEVPSNIRKYWQQRHSIWSKYDEGILMTDDAWFGVTPEPVAMKIAEHLAKILPPEKTILIDAFAGVGGNSIAFARSGRFKQIFAIEKDAEVIKCAKHNAGIYGVKNKIFFVKGDCFESLPQNYKKTGQNAVIFASPPWGGPGYTEDAIFNLSTMEPYSLEYQFTNFSNISSHIALFLPRTSNLNQLARFAQGENKVQVMHYCMKGASKALCVYYGDFKILNEAQEEEEETMLEVPEG